MSMSIRATIERVGGTLEQFIDVPRFHVDASHSETGACATFPASSTIEDAIERMHRVQRDPAEATQYDRRCVIEFQPIMRMTVVTPVEET